MAKVLLAGQGFRYEMLKLFLADMDKAEFVTEAELTAKVKALLPMPLPAPAPPPTAKILGLASHVSRLETEVFKPKGVVALY